MATGLPDYRKGTNIDSQSSNLDINIDTQTSDIDVNLNASAVTLNTNISSQTSNIDVNLATQSGDIDVNLNAQVADLDINLNAQAVDIDIVSVNNEEVILGNNTLQGDSYYVGELLPVGTGTTLWQIQQLRAIAGTSSGSVSVAFGKGGYTFDVWETDYSFIVDRVNLYCNTSPLITETDVTSTILIKVGDSFTNKAWGITPTKSGWSATDMTNLNNITDGSVDTVTNEASVSPGSTALTTIDLGASYTGYFTALFWKQTVGTSGWTVKLQYSVDGSSWTDAFSAGSDGNQIYRSGSITARYIRLQITGGSSGTVEAKIYEMCFWSTG